MRKLRVLGAARACEVATVGVAFAVARAAPAMASQVGLAVAIGAASQKPVRVTARSGPSSRFLTAQGKQASPELQEPPQA